MLPKCVNRAAYLGARAVCRQEILDKGICEIPGFLKPSAVNRILSSAEELKRRTCGFRSFEEHNVYLEEKRDTSRVRSASFSSSKLLVNQAELTQDCPEIIELFRWDGLRFLLQEAFGLKRLFCSADPLGGVYLNFFEKGDQLGWHFDRSEYSVNLILRECPRDASHPGAFMYIPDSRDFLDATPDFDLSILDQPDTTKVEGLNEMIVPDLKPGTLYLFAGNRSLHCVSQNTTETSRVNAIFTFNPEPHVSLNEYTRKKFFGA